MINSITEAIAIALNGEFGDDYTVYIESVEQGLNEPCFFISCINPTDKLFFNKRYYRENQFCIRYFPADSSRRREECNAAAERLFSCLEYITVSGDIQMGTKMKYEITDGILVFFVNYDLFVYKTENSLSAMEELKKDISLKG